MFYIVIIGIFIIIVFFWIISVQRTLVVLDENINNALSQIGVQLSSRWDVLLSLLAVTKGYATHEYKTITKMIKARDSITRDSSLDDITKQENIIAAVIEQIVAVAEKYPELKVDNKYIKILDAVNQYEHMLRTSRLIYNDSVTKFNRSIHMFPVFTISGMIGFHKRYCIDVDNVTADNIITTSVGFSE